MNAHATMCTNDCEADHIIEAERGFLADADEKAISAKSWIYLPSTCFYYCLLILLHSIRRVSDCILILQSMASFLCSLASHNLIQMYPISGWLTGCRRLANNKHHCILNVDILGGNNLFILIWHHLHLQQHHIWSHRNRNILSMQITHTKGTKTHAHICWFTFTCRDERTYNNYKKQIQLLCDTHFFPAHSYT